MMRIPENPNFNPEQRRNRELAETLVRLGLVEVLLEQRSTQELGNDQLETIEHLRGNLIDFLRVSGQVVNEDRENLVVGIEKDEYSVFTDLGQDRHLNIRFTSPSGREIDGMREKLVNKIKSVGGADFLQSAEDRSEEIESFVNQFTALMMMYHGEGNSVERMDLNLESDNFTFAVWTPRLSIGKGRLWRAINQPIKYMKEGEFALISLLMKEISQKLGILD